MNKLVFIFLVQSLVCGLFSDVGASNREISNGQAASITPSAIYSPIENDLESSIRIDIDDFLGDEDLSMEGYEACIERDGVKYHDRYVKKLLEKYRAKGCSERQAEYVVKFPLHVAAKFGDVLALYQLLMYGKRLNEADDLLGFRPLHYAVSKGRESAVMVLLADKNIDVNAEDFNGKTALQVLISKLVITEDDIKILRRLTSVRGIDVNKAYWFNDRIHGFYEFRKWPLLHYAVKNGHEQIVQLLLEVNNLAINAIDKDGKTALHYAAEQGYGRIVKQLLAVKGIRTYVFDNNWQTPWGVAKSGYIKNIIQNFRFPEPVIAPGY